jgi:hypothetical protein
MELSELGRLARGVDQACRAMIERPRKASARDILFEARAPVVAPSFLDDRRQPASLQVLMHQTMHIGHGTREPQAVVSDLLQELDREKDV